MKSIERMIEKSFCLLAVVLCVASALTLPKATQAAFLYERVATSSSAMDMLAAGVEAEPGRAWRDHEKNIRDAVEHLDREYQVYAAAFKLIDGDYEMFTERYVETSPFEPFDFEEFVDAVATADYGKLVIHYKPDRQEARDLHVYFRWIPLYSGRGERYLVVAGVSKHSIISNAHKWLSVGLWILTVAVGVVAVRQIFRHAKSESATREWRRMLLSRSKKSGSL